MLNIFKNDGIALFVERPNRFIIIANFNGDNVICHCPNTGRMKELLFCGVKLILEKATNPNRKTAYSVVAVFKGELVVPIASVRANDVAKEIIIPSLFTNSVIQSEVTYKKSRFDFFVDTGGLGTFIEVKSCTLFNGLEAIFPDAPTSRGVKHLNELEDASNNGYKSCVIFVVFNHLSKTFFPNYITDPLFAKTLNRVQNIIKVIPYKVLVNQNGLVTLPKDNPILPLIFKGEIYDKWPK